MTVGKVDSPFSGSSADVENALYEGLKLKIEAEEQLTFTLAGIGAR
jgi:hypothetical protein